MRASRESVAYREYEERFIPARSEPAGGLHAVPAQRRRKRARLYPGVCTCLVVLAVAAVYILFCHMQLTQLTAEVTTQADRLDELTAQNVSLSNKKVHSLNMDQVEAYAVGTLGMVKMDNSQIEYIELVNPDSVTVTRSGVSLDTLLAGLVRSFSAVVEYIR